MRSRISSLATVLAFAFLFSNFSSADAMANPASVYCHEQGYTSDSRADAAGEYSVCQFPDTTECEEWAYFSGECKVGMYSVWETRTWAQPRVFEDVSARHENYSAITYLGSEGVIYGYPDGTFGPDRSINRVEALKIILGAAHVAVKDSDAAIAVGFRDTNQGEWYTPYLAKSVDLGIVQGYPDGTFHPNHTVNMVEALKMVSKAFQVDVSTVKVQGDPYDDVPSGQWYSSYVQYGKDANLLVVKDNKVFPAESMTRSRFSEMLFRLMYIKDKDLSAYAAAAATADVASRVSAQVKHIDVGTSGMTFVVEGQVNPDITVQKGDIVVVHFISNSGAHTWVVDGYNAFTSIVGEGSSASAVFVADTVGTFEYYCSVGEHRAMGMKGKFVVEN